MVVKTKSSSVHVMNLAVILHKHLFWEESENISVLILVNEAQCCSLSGGHEMKEETETFRINMMILRSEC